LSQKFISLRKLLHSVYNFLFDLLILSKKLGNIIEELEEEHKNNHVYLSSVRIANRSLTKTLNINVNRINRYMTLFKQDEKVETKESQCSILCSSIRILLTEKIFIFSSLGISVLLYISTVITFWVSEYCKNVMKIPESTIFILFVVICVTAPASGIILGGCIVEKMGGYESKHSILFCLIAGALAGGLSILATTPIMTSTSGFAVILWLFLFFGGSIIPNMVGILLDCLPSKKLKGAGNSLNMVINSALGYLPGPYIYGVMYNNFKDTNPRIPFMITLLFSWIGVVCILIALIFRYKKFDEIERLKKIEAEIEENKLSKIYYQENDNNFIEIKQVILILNF
jgi:MFS family permease